MRWYEDKNKLNEETRESKNWRKMLKDEVIPNYPIDGTIPFRLSEELKKQMTLDDRQKLEKSIDYVFDHSNADVICCVVSALTKMAILSERQHLLSNEVRRAITEEMARLKSENVKLKKEIEEIKSLLQQQP